MESPHLCIEMAESHFSPAVSGIFFPHNKNVSVYLTDASEVTRFVLQNGSLLLNLSSEAAILSGSWE